MDEFEAWPPTMWCTTAIVTEIPYHRFTDEQLETKPNSARLIYFELRVRFMQQRKSSKETKIDIRESVP